MRLSHSSRVPGRLVLLAVFGFLYLPIAVLVGPVLQRGGAADKLVRLFLQVVCGAVPAMATSSALPGTR